MLPTPEYLVVNFFFNIPKNQEKGGKWLRCDVLGCFGLMIPATCLLEQEEEPLPEPTNRARKVLGIKSTRQLVLSGG